MESLGEEQEAAAMAPASPTLWSLLHSLAQDCAGYLGLGDYTLGAAGHRKPAAADGAKVQEEGGEFRPVVEVQSRSMAFQRNRRYEQGVGGRGGIKN